MIIGIGFDLIDIPRIEKVIGRHGDRFPDRIFTDAERAKAERRAKAAQKWSGRPTPSGLPPRRPVQRRWAPESGKASGGGTWGWSICPEGVRPMKLTGGRSRGSESLTPKGFEARIDLTITDDWPLAQAFVIISAVPAAKG